VTEVDGRRAARIRVTPAPPVDESDGESAGDSATAAR